MKKILAVSAAFAVFTFGQAYAAQTVARADASLTLDAVAKNGSSAVIVAASDADGAPVTGLKPMASVSPSYAATVGAFTECGAASASDLCAQAGVSAAGTYVAKITAKDVEGDARVGVYLPGKFVSVVLKVGSSVPQAAAVSAPVPEAVATVATVSSEAAPKASAAKAGGGVRGALYALGLLVLAAVPAALALRLRKAR